MVRQLFSSEARQCIKAKPRGNLHPRDQTIETTMHPLIHQMSSKVVALLMGCMMLLAWMPEGVMARDPYPPDQVAPPPEGVPMKIEVPRGRAVLITLSAYSITSPIIRFKIKRQADAGKLGTPHMASATTAVVRYQPPAGAGPGDDSFEFAVQSDAGVSAPAEVDITITDKPPLFIAPTDIEFGQVLTGGSVKKSLELQNLGGGMAEGTVKTPDGWSVDGDPDYHLGGGAKQTFTVIFNPTAQQVFTGDIEYTGNLDRATDLNGEGVGPLAVTTGTVQLIPAGSMRAGSLNLVNRTNGALTVKLTPGPGVQTDPSVTVPPNGAASVTVQAAGAGEIDDHVTVEGMGLKQDVPVFAPGPAPSPEPEEAAMTAPSPAGEPVFVRPPAPPRIAQVSDSPPVATPTPADNDLPPISLPSQDAGQDDSMPQGIQIVPLQIGIVSMTHAEVGADFKGDTQAQSYRLELETIGMDSQAHPVSKWIPFPGAALSTRGQIVIAQMPDLLPGTLYVVRIAGMDDQGSMIEASTAQGVTTVMAPPPWWRRWEKEEVLLALAVAAWWWWQNKKRRRW
jgi:hypothetical protein